MPQDVETWGLEALGQDVHAHACMLRASCVWARNLQASIGRIKM